MAADKSNLSLVDELISKGVDVTSLLKEVTEKYTADLKASSSVPVPSNNSESHNEEAETVVVKSEKAKGKRARGSASSLKETPTRKRTKTLVSRKSSRISRKPEADAEPVDDPDDVVVVSSPAQRSIISEITFSHEWMKDHFLGEVLELLKAQHWEKLGQENVEVNINLIRDFYSCLRVEERQNMTVAYFKINEEEYMFSSKDLSNWLEVPHAGYSEYMKRQWPASVARKEVQERVGPDTLSMGIVNRVVHRILCQNLTPRLQKHEQLLIQDYMLMDKIILKEQINLPRQMMHHMSHVMGIPNHGLPYPGAVKKILQHFELYVSKDEEPASKEFDDENCDRLGFKFDEEKGWTKEGTFEPAGKEIVTVNKSNLNLREEFTKIQKDIETLTKQFANTAKETSEKLSSLEGAVNVCQVHTRSMKEDILSSLDKIMKKVEHAADCSDLANQKTKEALIELDKHISSVGKHIINELNDIFLTAARCTEGLSAQPKP